MRSGDLNRQIIVERKVVTQDATYGTDVIDWQPIAMEDGSPELPVKFWAELQDVLPSRSEAVRQGLPVAKRLTRVRMRFRPDIEPDMRVKVPIPHGDIPWGDARWWTDSFYLYQIVSGPAEIQGRRRMIEFVMERYSTDGGA